MVNNFNIDPNAIYSSLNNFGNEILDKAKRKADRIANKINTRYGAGNQYRIDPKAKTVGQIRQARQTQQAINTGKNIDKAMKTIKTAGKAGAEFGLPGIGGGWDMYSGYQKIKDGNPLWGAGQMLYGAGELGLDAVGLIGSAFTGGGAEAADMALSAAARKGMQTLYRNLIRQGVSRNTARVMAMNSVKSELAKNAVRRTINNTGNFMRGANRVINSPKANIGSTVFFEGGNALSNLFEGDNDNASSDNQQPQDVTQIGNSNSQPTTQQGNVVRAGGGIPSGYYSGGSSGVVNPQAVNQAINNATTQQPSNAENSTQYSGIDPGEIYRRYLDKQEALEPYRRGLYNYVRDYHRLSDLSYNQDKYLALLAAQTGASGLNNMIGKYTAIGDEAKALDLQKLYGNEIKNVGEGLDKLQGNIAMAQQMGLPIESVLADDDYVKLALQKEMASDKLENALLRLQMNLDNKNYWNNAKYQLSKARLGNSRGGGRSSKGNTIGAYNILSRMIEEGNDPGEATRFVNANFGTNFTTPPNESANLYSGKTLRRK